VVCPHLHPRLLRRSHNNSRTSLHSSEKHSTITGAAPFVICSCCRNG
jgi:hypothetical protein